MFKTIIQWISLKIKLDKANNRIAKLSLLELSLLYAHMKLPVNYLWGFLVLVNAEV